MSKKVLILSTGDVNGAYEAMYKVAHIMKNMGHEVVMCVKHKTKNEDFIKTYKHLSSSIVQPSLLARIINKVKNKLNPVQPLKPLSTDRKYSFFSKDELKENIHVESMLKTVGFTPEFIFTGMTIDFLNSTDLLNIYNATKAKIYNITVDMNHFTGGCHFSWGCEGYIRGCDENCPAITKEDEKVTAKNNFERKYKNAQKAGFKIIAGSGLTLIQAQNSKIYKNQETIYNINSLIDTKLLNDKNKSIAKNIFSLSDDCFYILTGAQNMEDPRKGFSYLLEALEILDRELPAEQKEKIVLLVVSNSVNEEFDRVTFKKQKIDYIKDYRLLSLLYQAADLFINSSIEDSGPMMVSEALACGTPVVGFDTGVVMNMVINDYNGYKAPLKDSQKLAEGIRKIFELNKDSYNTFSKNAVKQVEEFSSYEYAEEIFKNILES
ncbi:glycosyltransferase involved in cell wall biosynthesis [Chryseobacterium sediminis]|uniref:Glycosyltransferase involved in cell wall biosynthesis n=1 Tax=Chryseobacterium sediminis TaxID=1679494 RepID=A0ABR6Q2S1_9FLAO|nr:glycosyltransferase [Chryseobacterium sediminis]MBB6332249.1 glycosyltransferase involved in cell wall biosynthesis [Chryseobacterium sediminis]